MAWVSWQHEYLRWLDAIANRNIDAFFISSNENSREMRTTYSNARNLQEFTAWLKAKADEEAAGISDGEMSMCIGGC